MCIRDRVTLDSLEVINNASIGGVLTYEDVTNVDSIGIITARAGVLVGSGITLSKDGDVFFTGIATGNGSGLTALNASNIGSGTVPTARLGSGTASSSTFLRGDSTFAAVTSTTINNNADNRVITGSGTADTLQGESNLTFDGTSLDLPTVNSFIKGGGHNIVQVDATKTYLYGGTGGVQFRTADNSAELINITNDGKLLLGTSTEGEASADNLTIADSANCGITIRSGSSNAGGIYFSDGTSGADEYRGIIAYNHASNFLRFFVGATERLRINSSGHLQLGTTTAEVSAGKALMIAASDGARIKLCDSDLGVGISDGYEILVSGNGTAYVWNRENTDLLFGTNNTERWKIASGGDLLPAADRAIDFQNQTITSTSNYSRATTGEKLDYYEEGTIVPTAISAGLTFSTDSQNKLRYVRIGHWVSVSGYLSVSSYTSNNNTVQVAMPFTSAPNSEGYYTRGVGAVMHRYISFSSNYDGMIAYVGGGENYMRFFQTGHQQDWLELKNNNFQSNSAAMYFSVNYMVT